jgi:hypothetical protein
MSYRQSVGIVSLKVLNEQTGEHEDKRYREEREIKAIRGGYRRMYKDYDAALIDIVKSGKDLELLIVVRDQFTYMRVECVIAKADIAKMVGVSERKVTDMVNRMVDAKLLGRIARGVYRLNPFMYLPFRADGEQLQLEWRSIFQSGEVK